jgi:group II intron reverse transcriptase/maturase
MLPKNRSTIPLSARLERIENIRRFQRKLYLKAKRERDFRFYVLYDKICRWDILVWAWYRVKANGGSPGVDGLSFADIERQGIKEFLQTLQRELQEFTYKPLPVLRCYIEKDNGKLRPLGIPVIRDRVVQMACKIVIEPIFEADFEDCSYGFRPKRSAHDAIKRLKQLLNKGYREVYDADLSQYFDTIPHARMMELIERRISDRDVLNLIRMWLKTPVAERTEKGRLRYTSGKRSKRGTPQGGVISPLLANLYLHELDKEFSRKDGTLQRCGAHLVRYADDFVSLARYIGEPIKRAIQSKVKELEVRLNDEKTHIVRMPEESFDFLGFTFRYDCHLDGKPGRYLNIFPSKKSQKKLRGKLRGILTPGNKKNARRLAAELNSVLIGWRNYFSAPGTYPRKAFRDANWYLNQRLNRFYRRKSQRRSTLYGQRAYEHVVKAGLVVL